MIDTLTNSVTATLRVGFLPGAVAVSRDGATLYVANTADSTLSVIDTATSVVTTTTVGINPQGLATGPAAWCTSRTTTATRSRC